MQSNENDEIGNPFSETDGYGSYRSPFTEAFTSHQREAYESRLYVEEQGLSAAQFDNNVREIERHQNNINAIKLAIAQLTPPQS